ncbi:MAG: hypothetical protein ABI589_09425 [Burkholderiales bacterium]
MLIPERLSRVDVIREIVETDTSIYGRNIAQAPICLAVDEMVGDPGVQKSDELAREWARIRSRPNLTNCVKSERRNGCLDF